MDMKKNRVLSGLAWEFAECKGTFDSASQKLAQCRQQAVLLGHDTSGISNGEFFAYWKQHKASFVSTPAVDHGDFDDMGRGKVAGAYHHEQKRKHGRL